MAPIEPDLSNSNIHPVIAAGAWLTATTSILLLIGYRVFYRAYISLPPSQGVRSRQHHRRSHEQIFAGLAAASLAVAAYYGYQFLLLSYQIWAYERGEVIPTGLLTEEGILASSGPKIFLGRWFRDTDLIAEFWEICMEKTRRRWWTNQLLLSTAAWSTYVSIKGRAHAIPHHWSFVALAPLVSLPFAMNLFFLATLATPLPLPQNSTAVVAKSPRHGRTSSKALKAAAVNTANRTDSVLGKIYAIRDSYFPAKPQHWTPHPLVSLVPLLLTMAHTVLLSFASNTTAFRSLLNLLFIDIFLPVFLPVILPRSWGSTESTHHHHTKSLTTFSILSVALHIFQTIIAVMYNDPGAHRHRHSVLSFRREADRTRTERTASALSRIVGAISDHPAVGRIGTDVLLVSISLGTWAAVRGLDPTHILRAAGWVTKSELKTVGEAKDFVAREVQQLINSTDDADLPESPSPKRPAKRRVSKTIESGEAVGEKGPGARSYQGSATNIGEEDDESEWESGALAWGMIIVGGLTSGLAGVLGSDIGL